jgi:hypothetical protein
MVWALTLTVMQNSAMGAKNLNNRFIRQFLLRFSFLQQPLTFHYFVFLNQGRIPLIARIKNESFSFFTRYAHNTGKTNKTNTTVL